MVRGRRWLGEADEKMPLTKNSLVLLQIERALLLLLCAGAVRVDPNDYKAVGDAGRVNRAAAPRVGVPAWATTPAAPGLAPVTGAPPLPEREAGGGGRRGASAAPPLPLSTKAEARP